MSYTPRIVDGELKFPLYAYIPNQTAAVAVAVVFALLALVLIGQVFWAKRKRSYDHWKYFWWFILGVAAESVGYGIRKVSAEDPFSLGLYIGSQLTLILAPVVMALTCYMIFGRLIAQTDPRYSYVRPSRVTKTFIGFDVLSFVVQGAGGALYAGKRNLFTTAKIILTIGFLIQIFAFGCFFVFAIIYQVRARRGGVRPGAWSKLLYTLYLICIFILMRSIFRTIEFASGEGVRAGYLITRESWFYGLEAGPIMAASLVAIMSNPVNYLPLDRTIKEEPELERESDLEMSTAK